VGISAAYTHDAKPWLAAPVIAAVSRLHVVRARSWPTSAASPASLRACWLWTSLPFSASLIMAKYLSCSPA
jgi:hypothetical protein